MIFATLDCACVQINTIDDANICDLNGVCSCKDGYFDDKCSTGTVITVVWYTYFWNIEATDIPWYSQSKCYEMLNVCYCLIYWR